MYKVLIIDFGCEDINLLVNGVLKYGVLCEVMPYTIDFSQIENFNAKGIILSGSVHCSFIEGAPCISPKIYELGIPVLGICYGMQFTVLSFGGKVEKAPVAEFGLKEVTYFDSLIADGYSVAMEKMLHYDYVTCVPANFKVTAKTADCPVAAIECPEKNIYCLQFHPEFFTSEVDDVIFKNFLYKICDLKSAY